MKINYTFDPTRAPAAANGPVALGHGQQQVKVFGFNVVDSRFVIEPKANGPDTQVPVKLLRQATVKGAIADGSLVVDHTTAEPHKDYQYCRDSTESSYITKAVVGTGMVKKIMPAGAQVGDKGMMELYGGATTVNADETGEWSHFLAREFVVTAADIAARDLPATWPLAGDPPTVTADYNIIEGGAPGDGYNHI